MANPSEILKIVMEAALDANHINAASHFKQACLALGISLEDGFEIVKEMNVYQPEGLERFKQRIGLKK